MASVDLERLNRNVEDVRRRIVAACGRAGRDPDGVALVAVTKSLPEECLPAVRQAGLTDVGENRPVEGLRRVGSLEGVRRHMVGHVQTNKVGKTLEWAHVLHSVDRPELVAALVRRGCRIPVYLQVNVSGESTKGGWRPEEIASMSREGLNVAGLMTMAPAGSDARPHFRRLRELAGAYGWEGLSMGMSQDFEAAVEEGATVVRIGTALFEKVLI